MMGKCLDSNGREVTEWKLTMRFFLERGEMKSSSLEYWCGRGLEGSGGGNVSRGVISAYAMDWAGVSGLNVEGMCIENVERKSRR